MDLRRLTIVLVMFAAGLAAMYLLAHQQKPAPQTQPASAPAGPAVGAPGAPASRPVATAPAATGRAGQAATEPGGQAAQEPSATAPTATAAGRQPFVDYVPLYADTSLPSTSAYLGGLGPGGEYEFRVDLNSMGAGVERLRLANDFTTVADKKRYNEDPATYAQAVEEDPEKYKGFYAVLSPVKVARGRTVLPLATGTLKVELPGASLPFGLVNLDELNWKLLDAPAANQPGREEASFRVVLHEGVSPTENRPLLKITKTYRVAPRDFSVGVTLTAENLSGSDLSVSIDQSGPCGLPREDPRTDMRRAAYGKLNPKDGRVQVVFKDAWKLTETPGGEDVVGTSDGSDPLVWIGATNKFFGSMMYLEPMTAGSLEAPAYRAKFYARTAELADGGKSCITGVRLPDYSLHAGQAGSITFNVFAGPKARDIFTNTDAAGYRELYSKLNYIGTIEFRSCFCSSDWLALGVIWALNLFTRTITFGNYGVAIILLVLLVRFALHPLTRKSQISMMGMQKLAPAVEKLKQKYADDKNALNREMMKLYKEQGAGSMVFGCLPLLLQMPILIALYTGVNAAVELRQAAFLPVWITDLSAPDALFSFGTTLPFLGSTFNLLPILLGVAMFFQQKYTPTSPQASTGSDQAQQTQKMMKYMMPGMMIVFFYQAASGLTLYFMASTFGGVVDQYLVRRHIRMKDAAEAAEQTMVTVPGKAPRTSRPKKPKGPFWVKRG